jgi:excisionase family DNA binding protein
MCKGNNMTDKKINEDEFFEHRLFTVDETCKILKCGRTSLYELLKLAEIKALKMKGMTRISGAEIKRYQKSLPVYQSQTKGS